MKRLNPGPGNPCHAGSVKTVVDRPLDLEDLLATPEDGNRYEGGAAWYWLVDPAVPNLTVLCLAGQV